MANYDYWTDGPANWDTPTDWSAGLPDSTSDVVIKGLGARTDVTASFGTVASIGINTKGVLNFEAGASSVTGGVSIRSQLSGRHTSTLYLDEGSSLTIGGRLTNSGFILIGLNNGTTASTIQAAALSNTGIIHLNGSSTAQATIDLTSAAGFGTKGTLTGDVELSGDALIEFKGGQITTIAANSDLVLQGPHAFVADASDTNTNSALERLSTVTGVLELENGATITIAGGVSISDNASGGLFLDSYSAGGSSLTIGGALTNNGEFEIGDSYLSASTTVRVRTLVNSNQLFLQGNAKSGTTKKASLIVSGDAPSSLTGSVRVGGDATLQFGWGHITTIASGASLELSGSRAMVLTGGGASSALSALTENDGTLTLQGNSDLGAGGVTLKTSKSLTNGGTLIIDRVGDGGSAVTLGGRLTNGGVLDIGDSGLSASTTMTTTGLTNSGAITLLGHGLGTRKAELIVQGDAMTSGTIDIGPGALFYVTGANSFTQDGGSTTVEGLLRASSIDVDSGVLDFKSAVTSGDGVGALNIGATGNLEFDAAVDSTHGVDFTAAAGGTLALGDAGAFSGSISGFAGSDAIDLLGQGIASLAYSGSTTSGVLMVTGSTGTIAELSFAGDYKTSSFTFASDMHGGSKILHT